MIRHCPALFVSAPASGQGKTLVTAALARRHRNLGRHVRVFKTGPDFLDPMILARASGNPVYQLDLFMGGEAHCRQLLYDAAGEADLILIEGVMGLFDGNPSSADLAVLLDIPALAVINADSMAQTFGAVALGLASYRPGLRLAGVLANRVAGKRHADMLQTSLPPTISWFGALSRDAGFALPERHLGLVQASEIADLDDRIDGAAAAFDAAAEQLPALAAFAPGARTIPSLLHGRRIAVAHDAAFSFIYPANLDLLAAMGADLAFFSPLTDSVLPECDALWLPGGYPELYLGQLGGNTAMKAAICAHHGAGKPILAECGGMLYLAESLSDVQGQAADMAGLLPAQVIMQPRLAALGLQAVSLPEGDIRGHTFHHSRLATMLAPLVQATDPNGGMGEAVYRLGKLTASYVHFYFPSNAQAAAKLFLP
ncbi:MAG: cobyrinate a,c-diamide synthase [Sterolibacterium sp.]